MKRCFLQSESADLGKFQLAVSSKWSFSLSTYPAVQSLFNRNIQNYRLNFNIQDGPIQDNGTRQLAFLSLKLMQCNVGTWHDGKSSRWFLTWFVFEGFHVCGEADADLSLHVSVSQLRFRVAWWVQGTSAVGPSSVSTTTRVKSKGYIKSVSLCCTMPGTTTRRWGEAWHSDT